MVKIKYDLYDLPSAYHKAGLAGLLFLIQQFPGKKPTILELDNRYVELELSEENLRPLMDEFYAMIRIPKESKKEPKKKGRKSKKVEMKDVARLEFLRRAGVCDEWIKMWRSCISLSRSGQAFLVYRKGYDVAQVVSDLEKSPDKSVEVKAGDTFWTTAKNNELVSMRGKVKENFLLQFAIVVSLPFYTCAYKEDKGRLKSSFIGYSLATPEPSQLKSFVEGIAEVFRELSSDFREYKVLLPLEGALEYMRYFVRRSANRQLQSSVLADNSILQIHVNKLVCVGKNYEVAGYSRIRPNEDVVLIYDKIHRTFKSPVLRPLTVNNLIRGQSLFFGLCDVVSDYPNYCFVYDDAHPFDHIGVDLHRYSKEFLTNKEIEMSDEEKKQMTGEQRIRDAITNAVSEDNILYKDINGLVYYSLKTRSEAKQGQASDSDMASTAKSLWYGVESLHHDHFVSWFTSQITIPGVGVSEFVLKMLLKDWYRVKCVTQAVLSSKTCVRKKGN